MRDAPTARTPVLARAGLWLLWGLVAYGLADAVGLVPLSYSESDAGYWLWVGPSALAAALILGRSRWERRERGAWLLVGLGMTSFALGDVLWTAVWTESAFSPADAFYILFYPLLFAGLVGLLRSRSLAVPGSTWLDGIMGVLAILAFAVAVLGPTLERSAGGTLENWVKTVYPLLGAVTVAFVIAGSALARWRPGIDWLALGAGLTLMAVGDGVYALEVAFDENVLADRVTWGAWALAAGLLGTAAWVRSSARPLREAPTALVLAFPGILFTLAVGVLVVAATTVSVRWPAVALAAAALMVAVARAVFTLRELRALPEVRRQAATDELTGLCNRRSFLTALEAELAHAGPTGSFSVLLFDLDRFKELNDALGHAAGDRLLAQLAPRLAAEVRHGDVLARLGGDEFAVICHGARPEAAERVARRLLDAMAEPMVVDGLEVVVEASLGQACHPTDGLDADALLRHADTAMYRAKADGGVLARYDPSRDERRPERLALLGDLRRALRDDDGLVVHLQPQIDLVSGRVAGLEALVRWEHPQRGSLLPGDFLDLAETAGLLRALSRVVLERSGRVAADLRAAGHELPVAFNLAASDVVDAGLPAEVLGAMERHGLPPGALRVEVTESIVLRHPERAMRTLAALREIGVPVALDDFGVGHSSLDLLRQLPADELKVDRSFVAALPTDRHAAAIVRAIVGLGRDLGLRVVAEGVETEVAAEAVTAAGADAAQGWLFARAMAPEALDGWLAEHAATSVQAR